VPAQAAATSAELAAITERGRALFEYDAAAADSTDAVLPRAGSDTSNMGFFIGRKSEAGWTFDFGKLDADRTTYRVAYRAVRASGSKAFEVTKFETPIAGDDFDAGAARGVQLAATDFGPVNRAYNYAVLPAPEGNFYVYYYPAQTTRIHPLGGDERYLVSADGRSLLDKHRMHRGIFDQAPPEPQPGYKIVFGNHTILYSDVPEDTDVFHVLIRRPKMAEYVGTRNHEMFLINLDGSIEDKGPVPVKNPSPDPSPPGS
jgi:hypothetical protein